MMKRTWKVNGCAFTEGDRVELEVTWHDGRRTFMLGALRNIVGKEAFIVTSYGLVAGSVSTLEKA